ncbi:transposase [Streptomyces albidoflavus]
MAGTVGHSWMGITVGRPARYDRLPKTKEGLAAYVLQVGEDGMWLLRSVYQDGAPPPAACAAAGAGAAAGVDPAVLVRRGRPAGLAWSEGQPRPAQPPRCRAPPGRSGRGQPRHRAGAGALVEYGDRHSARCRGPLCPPAGQGGLDRLQRSSDGNLRTDGPNVIVHVTTQTAPEQDISTLESIHRALAERDLLPAEHLVDAGYVSLATILRAAVGYGVILLGPVRPGSPCLRRPGFDKRDFHIDWDQHTATCPRGVTSPPWNDTQIDGQPGHSVLFPRAACRACEDRLSCTGNTGGRGRHLLLMPRPQQEIQNRARAEQETLAWKARYAMRAGCEATVSETVHAHGLRHCRYRGLAKVHVQHVLTAAGTNIIRLSECFPPGTTPPRTPRPLTPFQQLCQNTENPPAD